MSEVDPRALRNAFGTFMTGVTVVTTHDKSGQPLGFTANSFASVSLDPPLVLVCLANSSRNFAAFNEAEGFAVNVLAEDQMQVSNTFASPVEDRFATVDWTCGPQGSPIFSGVSAWFDCSMFNRVDAGDHLILIGKVEAFDTTTHPGLGYARGAYVTPAAEAEAVTNSADLMISALIEYDGKVLLLGNEDGRLTLPESKLGRGGATETLKRLISDVGVEAEPGFVYSVYEDEARETQHISFLCQASGPTSTKGKFTDLGETTLMSVADPVICTMLDRFARENRMGNFGVYYGNQISGKVRPLTTEG
ncbi:flavin reductase family protein [Gelidibacter sp. F2691]|nr:flavin reductase family protein [Gelidibacter sp. F2691]